MAWSDMEARCKKHPSHRQSKGVCPYCLRERLAHLSASSSTTTTTGSSSSRTSIYLSDSNNSNNSPRDSSSPPPRVDRVKMAALLKTRPEEPLTKSRSLAFVVTAVPGKDVMEKKAKIKGGARGADTSLASAKTKGFWARLMPGKTRRRDNGAAAAAKDLAGFHSNTLKETASARWVL